MTDKKLSRAYQPPVPAGQVVEWIGSPPANAGVLPLLGQGFNGAHFPQLLEQHGDAVLPTKAAVDGVYPVVGHGQQGDVHLVSNDTDVNFDDIVYDFGETIQGFRVAGNTVIVWADYGKVWGSTDGGNNFTLLPTYLNSGSSGTTSGNRIIQDLQYGNGVWLACFDSFFAVCRGDILVPANWETMPSNMGGLSQGITTSKHKIATDRNGNWLVAGAYHQFAWTNDDWLTINLTEIPADANSKIPCNVITYSRDAFCFCTDDGVFFAGSEISSPQRSDDGLTTWTVVTSKFNTGATTNTNPSEIIDIGNGHYMINYDQNYFAESFDMGFTWVRRAVRLGLSSYGVSGLSTDKKGMVLALINDGNANIHTSKNSGQTFTASSIQSLSSARPILYWRDAWYGITTDNQKLVRSTLGYTRTEWELI